MKKRTSDIVIPALFILIVVGFVVLLALNLFRP